MPRVTTVAITTQTHSHCGWPGGGIKPGITYGRSDDYGYEPVENPVQIADLHATILATLGLDHKQLTYRHAGRDFRLTDVKGTVIDEIFAS